MTRRREAAGARLWHATRIIHPFPTLMNVIATAGLGLLASEGHLSFGTLLRLMLTMLAIQCAIGIVNDLRDRDLDALSKPAKPLVRGALTRRTGVVLAVLAAAASALLAGGFGKIAWILAMAGLATGLVYDLWLKRTVASGLPYALGLPLLPLWVWVALGRFRPALYALIPLGLLIGFALHLANSLPDFEEDSRAGVRGLAQRLGRRRTIALCWGCFGLTLLLVAASIGAVGYRLRLLLPGLLVAAFTLAGAVLLFLRRPGRESLQIGWGLLVVGSAALALGWLGALP